MLLADENKEALEQLAGVLRRLGHEVVPFAVSVREAVELMEREDPDAAIVVLHRDDEHGLRLIEESVAYASGPVLAQFHGPQGADVVARAAELGIDAHVHSTDPGAVQAALEVALRRHRDEQKLHAQVEQLESAMQRRAIVERAKGILMERHSLDERAAFERLREHSRSSGRRLVEVAQGLLDAHALLPPR